MTLQNLIDGYYQHHPNGHFFDVGTLKFFGERRSEMRVLKDIVTIKDYSGEKHKCYVLSSYQRKHPICPKRAYHYFDIYTFDSVEPSWGKEE